MRRRAALQHCVEQLLYPMFANEVRQKLIAEARTAALETVQLAVRKKMYRLLAHKGWRPPRADDGDEAAADDEELFSDSVRQHGASPPIGPRTLAITYSGEQYVWSGAFYVGATHCSLRLARTLHFKLSKLFGAFFTAFFIKA